MSLQRKVPNARSPMVGAFLHAETDGHTVHEAVEVTHHICSLHRCRFLTADYALK